MGCTTCVSHLVEKVEFEGSKSVVTVSGTVRWLGKNVWKCVRFSVFVEVGIFLFCLSKRLTLLLRSTSASRFVTKPFLS